MIRYKRLGYLALNVTDPERTAAFYRDLIGLQVVQGPRKDWRYVRCSAKFHDIVLCPAPRPGLKRIGFELESEAALHAAASALDRAGVRHMPIPPEDARDVCTSGGLRTVEPASGATLDLYLTMLPSQAPPFVPTLANIQRLGHVVLKSADHHASVRFFRDVLNFRVSDAIEEAVTFMRCFPNPLHHSLGIGNGRGKTGLHHVNFMVSDVDDIGKAIWRFNGAGVPIVNGPGRHPPSGSMFLYYLDPDGLTIEYSFGMEEFPEHDAREPRMLPAERKSFDYWGAPVDPRKSAVGEIETASFPSERTQHSTSP